jgi:hypothetical protein
MPFRQSSCLLCGHATHLIDFCSHNLTDEWNGHWAVGDGLWSAIRGRRPYLLNRDWGTTHLQLAADNELRVVLEHRNKRFDGLVPAQFSPRFRAIPDEDARTRMMFVVMQRMSGH